jgi:hypothetical protein
MDTLETHNFSPKRRRIERMPREYCLASVISFVDSILTSKQNIRYLRQVQILYSVIFFGLVSGFGEGKQWIKLFIGLMSSSLKISYHWHVHVALCE